MLNPQTDDSTFGAIDPSLALGLPSAAQTTAALRPAVPAAQATAALRPPAKAPLAIPSQGDPLAGYYQKVRAHESGGNDAASSGVAYGRYQFTPQTWLAVAIRHPELGLDKTNILDGAKQDEAMRALTADNAAVLQKNGIGVTPQNLFMLHFLGEGGGPKFLRAMQADPAANAAALFPLETRYNPTIFSKPDGQPRTLAEVYGLMTKSFGGGGAPAVDPLAREVPSTPGFSMQIAEGPATTMTDVSSAPDPSLPPGAVPITVTDDPSLPPGAVPIGGGVVNPYAVERGKPAADPTEVEGVTEFGEPIFKDPAKQRELQQGEAEFGKGVLSGVAQDVTGVGEWLPNALGGGYAAEWTRYLQGVGAPIGQKFGRIAPLMLPIGDAAAALKGGAEAISESGSIGANLLRGARSGAIGGGIVGGTAATGDPDTGSRLLTKGEDVLERGVAGALVGGAGPAVLGAGKWAAGEIGGLARTLTGSYEREAERAAEDLRTGVSAETSKALSAEERRAAEKAAEESETRTRLAAHEADLRRIEEAQARLKLRDEVRAAEGRDGRQSLDPEAAARLKSQVVQRVRDRVFEAEKAAKEAGLSAEEARGFAVEQERVRTAAEQDAADLVEQFRNRMPATKEELGDQIREAALKDMREQRTIRERESGFAKAVASDGGQPSVPTKQFIQKIGEAERRAVSPGAQSTLAWLRNELKTAQPGGSITSVSIQRARRIVQALDSRIEGLPPDEAHEITALKDAFVEHIENTHPAMKTAREEYARLSRPLDVYERSGALKKAVQSDPYSGDAVVDSTRIAGALLNKTEDGADALARLAARDPRLVDSIRGYFNQQLFGAGKSVTPQSFERFLADNHIALERVGLGDLKDVATAEKLFAPQNSIEFRGATYSGESRLDAVRAAHRDTGVDLERVSNESTEGAAQRELSDPRITRHVKTGYVFTPEGITKSGDNGIHYSVSGDAVKILRSELPSDVAGRGVGTKMYRDFVDEMQRRGRTVQSDDAVSAPAVGVWKKLAASNPAVKENPHVVTRADGSKMNPTRQPVYTIAPVKPSGPDRGPLADEFERLGSQLRAKQHGVAQAKIGEASAAEQAKLAEQSRRGALDKVSEERGLLEKAKKREAETVRTTEKAASAPVDAAAGKARGDETRLREQQGAAKKEAASAQQDISRLASERTKVENLRTRLASFTNRLGPKVATKISDVTRESRSTANFLQENHYISDAQHKELLVEIERVDKSNETAEKAAKRLKQIIIAVAVAAYPSYELGHYVSHRITP